MRADLVCDAVRVLWHVPWTYAIMKADVFALGGYPPVLSRVAPEMVVDGM
jgi:hypothetical protein